MEYQINITRKLSFCAAHRLHNENWSEEKNREIYGVCNNPQAHGHNYDLEVTLRGAHDRESGMIINIHYLKEILKEEIIDRFDHKYLNEVPILHGTITTMENLAEKIAELLDKRFSKLNLKLVRLILSESKKNYVTLEML